MVIHKHGISQPHGTRMVSFVSTIDTEDRLLDSIPTRLLNTTYWNEFTIVSVLTYEFSISIKDRQNRLFFFDYLLQLWPSRFVFVLFYYGYEEATLHHYFSHKLFPHRMHVVFYSTTALHDEYTHFPVNTLRNLGIANVQTSHFIVTDMDLWPSRTPLFAF